MSNLRKDSLFDLEKVKIYVDSFVGLRYILNKVLFKTPILAWQEKHDLFERLEREIAKKTQNNIKNSHTLFWSSFE